VQGATAFDDRDILANDLVRAVLEPPIREPLPMGI
jgi:hypothetical protein